MPTPARRATGFSSTFCPPFKSSENSSPQRGSGLLRDPGPESLVVLVVAAEVERQRPRADRLLRVRSGEFAEEEIAYGDAGIEHTRIARASDREDGVLEVECPEIVRGAVVQGQRHRSVERSLGEVEVQPDRAADTARVKAAVETIRDHDVGRTFDDSSIGGRAGGRHSSGWRRSPEC